MGRKVLLILTCLAFSVTLGEPEKSKVKLIDNIAKESGSRLYRNVPVGVYASAAPHAAYSFHAPTVTNALKEMQLVPVNNIQNTNGFLRDSYGNKYVDTPQMIGFKTTFPQQFVRLQDLPLHLSQPLVSGASGFQQGAQHFFAPTQFRVQGLQASGPSPFARYAAPQPIPHNANIINFAASPVLKNNFNPHPVAQQQPSSNKAIFVNLQSNEQQSKVINEPKFQRLQEAPQNLPVAQENKNKNFNHPHRLHVEKEQLQVAPAKITTYVNGKKTVVTLETKPPLPLLDISLLEPLTFDNPLVPQVQHFLPRIHEATYHTLSNYNANNKKEHKSVQLKPKTQDSGVVRNKPKSKNKSKPKKQPGAQQNENENDYPTPDIKLNETPNASPELSYEINSPNYKETYKEQVVSYNKETTSKPVTYSYNKEKQSQPVHYSYNKETKSEPIHYTYEKQVQSKPIHYSYEQNSKEPQQQNQAKYENESQDPKHLTYTVDTENKNEVQRDHGHEKQPIELQEHSSRDDDTPKDPLPKTHNIHHEQYSNAPQSPHRLVPEHRQLGHDQKNHKDDTNIDNHEFPKSFMELVNTQINHGHYHARPLKYNNDKNQLPIQRPNEHIRVDPAQHIHLPQPERPYREQNNDYVPNQPIQHTYESKGVLSEDETLEGNNNEKQNREIVNEEENKEENFEKEYKNAAFGFPGYERNSEEIEEDIYNPEAYAIGQEHDNFDFEHAPFQQYYKESDKFPKETHSSYKDGREKVKENYFLDFSISKPESIGDRYTNKAEYFKMYKQHRPENYFSAKQNTNEEPEKQNAKYSAVPYYNEPKEKPKQQLARYQAEPNVLYEFDYAKQTPRDNSAHGSQPLQNFRTKTQFVEPEFQYGFEPSALPYLLDSELASMASNVSPENEKPGTRKKMYKENWYIKKSSTSGGTNKR